MYRSTLSVRLIPQELVDAAVKDLDKIKEKLRGDLVDGMPVPGVNVPAQVVLKVLPWGDSRQIFRAVLSENPNEDVVIFDVLLVSSRCDLSSYLHPSTVFFVPTENPLV